MTSPTPRVLVIHGPNLNRLGLREPETYGTMDLPTLDAKLVARGEAAGVVVEHMQANSEGALVDAIHGADAHDGVIINPAGYTHTSVALQDALRSIPTPSIEVHLSNLFSREGFRQQSLTAPACVGVIMGFGPESYLMALEQFIRIFSSSPSKATDHV